MKPTTIASWLAALLLAALALAACADAGGQGQDQGARAGGAATSTRAPAVTPPRKAGPPRVATRVVATGVVRSGVEPGCRLLAADAGPTYLLVGGDQQVLRSGARVRVTGTLSPDTLSTCQQGTPLRVTSARPG
jgi:predicted small secreted protein